MSTFEKLGTSTDQEQNFGASYEHVFFEKLDQIFTPEETQDLEQFEKSEKKVTQETLDNSKERCFTKQEIINMSDHPPLNVFASKNSLVNKVLDGKTLLSTGLHPNLIEALLDPDYALNNKEYPDGLLASLLEKMIQYHKLSTISTPITPSHPGWNLNQFLDHPNAGKRTLNILLNEFAKQKNIEGIWTIVTKKLFVKKDSLFESGASSYSRIAANLAKDLYEDFYSKNQSLSLEGNNKWRTYDIFNRLNAIAGHKNGTRPHQILKKIEKDVGGKEAIQARLDSLKLKS